MGTLPGAFEYPADNLGLGAYILVGVYLNGISDRFVWASQSNKGASASALPTRYVYIYTFIYAYMHICTHTMPEYAYMRTNTCI